MAILGVFRCKRFIKPALVLTLLYFTGPGTCKSINVAKFKRGVLKRSCIGMKILLQSPKLFV